MSLQHAAATRVIVKLHLPLEAFGDVDDAAPVLEVVRVALDDEDCADPMATVQVIKTVAPLTVELPLVVDRATVTSARQVELLPFRVGPQMLAEVTCNVDKVGLHTGMQAGNKAGRQAGRQA
jgi:hypothetical protein